jgi:hypothetical protein
MEWRDGMIYDEDKIESLLRKMMAGAITGTLYGLLLALLFPGSGVEISTVRDYIWQFVESVPIYLMFTVPVILIYGGLTSYTSDLIGKWMEKRTNKRVEVLFSLILHMLFGLILLWISFFAALLYFIVDRFLKVKVKIYKAIYSLANQNLYP